MNPHQAKEPTMHHQELVHCLLKKKALTFGDFTLKSGRESPYFFNLGALNDATSLLLLGSLYAKTIVEKKLPCTNLFGPAYKGIPLACFTATELLKHHQLNVSLTFNRKERKTHGEGGTLIGAPPQGKIIIIDDVITQGTAISQAIELIKKHPKATLAGIIVALDRQEYLDDGRPTTPTLAKKYHVPILSLLTINTLIQCLPPQQQQAMFHYQQKYCHNQEQNQ
jgi:orotate phosphoribosyltransferase